MCYVDGLRVPAACADFVVGVYYLVYRSAAKQSL